MPGAEARLRAVVRGRVQGVGFRYWARERAASRELAGWATNLPDGRVEIVAEGARRGCEQLLAELSSGRSPGSVADVTHSWGDPVGLEGFRVR